MALEERVELDISDALNSIGTLETALTSAGALFGASITEALSVLDSLSVGQVDASEVTTAIDAAVVAADTEPAVTADASEVTTAIDSAIEAADAEVSPDTDAGGITDDIDAAILAAVAIVTPDTDADAVTSDIEGAITDADAEVSPTADTAALVDEIEGAVADTDVTVEVSADTAQAEQEISDLGATATSASGGVDNLTGAVSGFTAASALGRGEVSGFGDGVFSVSEKAGVAGAAVTALAATTGFLFSAAAESEQAERRFANSLGDVAEQVLRVNIGGLNEDLLVLAERTGNDDEALLRASARLADLGRSAGATSPQIAETSTQINALAIRATTMNPQLGEAGEVADRLSAAFARGGRALVPYGIALTSAEINTRALADTGKASAADLTIFDKAAAGAAITVERLGDHLATDINEGAQSAEVQIRSLRQEFANAVEELGVPLLDPVVRSLRSGLPLIEQVAGDLAELATAVLPLVEKGIISLAPLVGGTSAAFGILLDIVSPVVDLLVSIPTPVLTAVAAFFAMRPALEAGGNAVGFLRQHLVSLRETGAAGIGQSISAGLASIVTPANVAAVGVGALVTYFISQASEARKAKEENQAYADQLGDTKKALDEVIEGRVAEGFRDQAEAVTDAGTSFEILSRQVASGRRGYDEFLAGLVRTGTISAGAARELGRTSTTVEDLAVATATGTIGNERLSASSATLVARFRAQQVAAEAAARTEVQQFAAQSSSNAIMVRRAETQNRLTGGTVDYVAVLRQVKPPLDAEATGQSKAAEAADDHARKIAGLNARLNELIETQLGVFSSSIALERAQLRVSEAARGLTEAELAAREAVAQHGAASDQAKEAQDRLHSAELDVRQSALDLAQAHLEAEARVRGVDVASLSAETQQRLTAAAFREVAGTVGVGSDLGQRLIETAQQLESLHPVNFSIEIDTSVAQSRVNQLRTSLDELNRNAVRDVLRGDLLPGVGSGQGQARGGPVNPWVTYPVNEETSHSEWFVPPVPGGYIATASQAQGAIRQAVYDVMGSGGFASPGGGGSTTNQYVTVNQVANDPRATAAAVSARIGQGARR